MTTVVLTRFEELEALSLEWERLWTANPRREIFGKPAWARSWWRAYGAGRSLRCPAVFKDEQLIGLLPLALDGRTLRFLGTPGSDYNDLLCASGQGGEVLREALDALRGLVSRETTGTFENIPERSLIVQHFDAVPARVRARMKLVGGAPCPTVIFGERGVEVAAAILRKKDLRGHRNALRRMGCLGFRHMTDREEIHRHLPQFFQQHIARRALAGDSSPFLCPKARAFHTALVDELDPSDDLRFGVLELDGRPIAYHLGFETGAKVVSYISSFDVNYWQHSPGAVLLGNMVEYAATRRLEEFDLTCGGEKFKDRFANRVRRNYSLWMYPPGLTGRARHRLQAVKEDLKARPAAYARLKEWAGCVDRWWRTNRHRVRRDGSFKLFEKLARRTFRTAVFARDEIVVFASSSGNLTRASLKRSPQPIEFGVGSLAELAHALTQYPERFDARALENARRRLERGDIPYVARQDGRLVHLVWLGMRTEVTVPEVGSGCRIALPSPEAVIYDAWTAPAVRGQGIYPDALRSLMDVAHTKSRRVWIYSFAANTPSLRGIDKAGFRATHRMVRIRVGHWWTRSWVHECRAS